MGLHDWAKRWAATSLWKVKAGKRTIPARHAIADRYRKKYREAVRSVLASMAKVASQRARAGAKTPFTSTDLKAFQKALYRAQIKILFQVVKEAYHLTGREIGAGRKAIAAGAPVSPDSFLIRQVQPSVEKWLKKISAGQTATFAAKIQKIMEFAQGYYDEDLGRGMTPAEMADVIFEEGLAATEQRAEMIARTNTIWAANEGAQAKYQEARVKVKRWLCTEDDLTCFFCLELDGKSVDISEPFLEAGMDFGVRNDKGKVSVMHISVDVDHPPAHPNCLVGPTPVIAPNHRAAFIAAYRGPIVEAGFSHGGRIASTINHMFLTTRGFIPAGELRKGDKVFHYTGRQRQFAVSGPNDDGKPTRIDEVVRAFSESRGVRSSRVPSSPKYLHGDGAFVDGEIHIISPDGLLRSDGQPAIPETADEPRLTLGTRLHTRLFGQGSLAAVLIALRLASDSGVSGLRELESVLTGRVGHSGEHTGTTVASLDPRLNEISANDVPGNTQSVGNGLLRFSSEIGRDNGGGIQGNATRSNRYATGSEQPNNGLARTVPLLGDLDNALPSLIFLADVVSIQVHQFSGHVFDLQTESGLYVAGGAIVHNCRCTIEPIFAENA